MKYKPGDEVLIKAEITDVHPESERPYFVQPCYDSVNWVSKNKLYRCDGNYEQGLADAWELARKLYCEHNDSERREILGIAQYETVLEFMTLEEAIAKIEAYEKEKKIKVGDEVVHGAGNLETKFCVTYLGAGKICGYDKNGNKHQFCLPNRYIKKTGKHIDIESLLKQIGE